MQMEMIQARLPGKPQQEKREPIGHHRILQQCAQQTLLQVETCRTTTGSLSSNWTSDQQPQQPKALTKVVLEKLQWKNLRSASVPWPDRAQQRRKQRHVQVCPLASIECQRKEAFQVTLDPLVELLGRLFYLGAAMVLVYGSIKAWVSQGLIRIQMAPTICLQLKQEGHQEAHPKTQVAINRPECLRSRMLSCKLNVI